jgi:hypothetical protein
MCASRMRRGRARYGAAEDDLASVGVLLPIFSFRSFVPFLPFVIAEVALADASTGICCGTFAWTTGIGVRRTPFCERLCRVVTSQSATAQRGLA